MANKCVNTIFEKIEDNFDIFLEPSAGSGSFFYFLPENKREGIDLDPKTDDIKKQDFLEYKPTIGKKYITIGNPPFGRVSSLAIKFFNKASEFSEVIAFIIPRTFKKVSVQNKLNPYFHLLYSEDLPVKPCCFEPSMNAKCCFQIWKKRNERRNIIKNPVIHKDFEFMGFGPLDGKNQPTPPEGADFALKAYGGGCGQIKTDDLKSLRPKSWHWIKCKNIPTEELITRFNSLDYSLSKDTVRQDSIGKAELVLLYSQKFY
jgi:hypothetical protein